jgi:hypothetical protein
MLCTHFLLTEYVDPRAKDKSAAAPEHAYPPPTSEPAVVALPKTPTPSIFRRYARRLARADLPALLFCA